MRVIHAHVVLREKSYYDSGLALLGLMEIKDHYGATDIKELVTNARLPMSHFSAQKYMTVARVFDREAAIRHKAEKCYGLVRYAELLGRPERHARTILERNEVLRGPEAVGARDATAAQVSAAVKHVKSLAVPAARAQEVERETAARETQALLRELGFSGARASVDRRGRIAITVSLEAAQKIDAVLPKKIARWGRKMMKHDPGAFAPLARAGWKPKA